MFGRKRKLDEFGEEIEAHLQLEFEDASSLDFRKPWLFTFMPLFVLGVAMLATYIPAHRASRVDPMSALRQE